MADSSTGGWTVAEWRLDPMAEDLGEPFAQMTNGGDWPGWRFRVRFNADMTVRGLDIDGTNGAPLTAERLRKVPIGTMAATVRAHMAAFYAELDKGREQVMRARHPFPAVIRPQVDMRRRGRRGRPDSELAGIAAAYVRCCAEQPATPMLRLAEEQRLDPPQLRSLLYQARRRGLLTKPAPGRPGGMLTPEGRAALPPPGSAWDSATDEQRAYAAKRWRKVEGPGAQFGEGDIDETTSGERLGVLFEEG